MTSTLVPTLMCETPGERQCRSVRPRWCGIVRVLCVGGGCGGGVVPRAGQVKPPAPQRLGDRVAIGALTSAFPPRLVDGVLAETGRGEQRRRLLPARKVVYYVLALALFADVAYLDVLRLLVEALRRPGRRHADPGGLRSKHPAGVEQEVWAHLLVHYAIRRLMHQAALDEGLDPDRLSFVGTLRIVRRHLASHVAFSP